MRSNKLFQYIVGFTAITLAFAAAYFSVIGIAEIFAGSMIPILFMASSIELGKIIGVSYLYRYATKIKLFWKSLLFLMVFSVMIITSAGIYGFLSNAHQKTAIGMDHANNEISLYEGKIIMFELQNVSLEKQIVTRSNRIQTYVDIRNQQEVRVDSFYNRRHWSSAKRTEKLINENDVKIQQLSIEIDSLNNKIFANSDSIIRYKQIINTISDNDFVAELGPIIYISELTGRSINQVVNWYIFLLIFVFDPLAIGLIVAYNHLDLLNKNNIKTNNISDELDDNEDEIEVPVIEKLNESGEIVEEIVSEKIIEVPTKINPISDKEVIKEELKTQTNDIVDLVKNYRSSSKKGAIVP